jgi:hypothetical protein
MGGKNKPPSDPILGPLKSYPLPKLVTPLNIAGRWVESDKAKAEKMLEELNSSEHAARKNAYRLIFGKGPISNINPRGKYWVIYRRFAKVKSKGGKK